MRSFLDVIPGKNPMDAEERLAMAPLPSDSVAQVSLAANTALRLAIPSGATFLDFSFSGDVWVAWGDGTVTAAIGSANTFGDNAELATAVRRVPTGITHISIISETALKGSISAWGF